MHRPKKEIGYDLSPSVHERTKVQLKFAEIIAAKIRKEISRKLDDTQALFRKIGKIT